MVICSRCKKQIKGRMVHIIPCSLDIKLGIATQRDYHPSCYVKYEKELEAKL